jgi:S1-C subfamily serine protease
MRGLRFIHGSLAFGSMAVALPIALLGGMALVGSMSETLWIRVVVPAMTLVVVPLLLADRLLPSDPSQRRPGLVRDVVAGSWTVAALAVLGLSSALVAAPVRAEAERHEVRGWTRAAWLGRWIAGPELASAPSETAQVETQVQQPSTNEGASENGVAEADPPPTAVPEPEITPERASAAEPAPREETDTSELSPADLFSRYAPAVVSIKTGHGGYHSGGTGFFVDANGTLATNHHVIDGAHEVRIKLFDGTELDRVELLASNEEIDLALLRVDPKQLPADLVAVQLGDSEAVAVGEPISVIGNPLGLEHTLSNGIVSARRIYEGERFIQMSAPISPGNSGGPVFDRHGRVIGVSVAHLIGGQNLNFAVPVSQLQALIAEDYPNRRSFGTSSW